MEKEARLVGCSALRKGAAVAVAVAAAAAVEGC